MRHQDDVAQSNAASHGSVCLLAQEPHPEILHCLKLVGYQMVSTQVVRSQLAMPRVYSASLH